MHAAKTVLRGKFRVTQAYLRKQEKSQINNLNLHLKQLEKEQTKPKLVEGKKSQRSDEKQMKKTIAKINKTKSWFFEKINKIDKQLTRLIKKKGRRLKSTGLEMKK